MKKRLFILLAVLAVAVSVLAVTANADTEVCPCCGEAATWKAISANTSLTDDHYYLTKGGIVFGASTIADGKTVCLDMRGYQVTFNKNFTVASGGTFRAANGTIVTRGIAGTNGGAFSVASGGSLYLEDVSFTRDTTYGRDVPQGGFIYADGEIFLTNTTLTGGVATSLGGNLFLGRNGEMTMDGGSITGGTATTGPCTYIRGKVTLKNNAVIDELHIVPGSSAGNVAVTDILNLDGSFTGSALLSFFTAPVDGDDIGNITTGANLSGLTVKDSQLQLKNTDGNLIAYLPIPVAILSGESVVSEHDTMTEALKNLSEGQTLKLQRDLDEEVTVSKDVTLDLNGNDLTAVNVTAGTLYVKDSKTDDYTVSDGVYGKIGSISGDVQGYTENEHKCYLSYTEDSGTSFHKLHMQLNTINLRSSKAALYFDSIFQGDEKVQAQISAFGVSMGLDKTELDNGTLIPGTYTAISPSKFNGSGDTTSSLLTNIMQTTQGSITNRRNAATTVYGKPYIKLTSGKILWGTTAGKSLQNTVETIDTMIKDGSLILTESQETDLLDMYYKFKNAMSKWSIPEVKAAYEAHEEETLKILTIGNSHANDSNWQLRNVFQQQNPDKKVVVGILYYSGCTVAEHVSFAQNNSAEYQYYKNETGTWTHDTAYDTMLKALEDEHWDIILLQEMNISLGQESSFQNNNIQTLIDYVNAHTTSTPKIGFNMVWANPVTAAYLDADTRMTHSMENGQSLDGWINTYERVYNTDQQYMFQCILDNTNKYIVANDAFDDACIMPSGTAVQYAHNVLGLTDLDLYRDYTHLSDFSRLMVSYLWYAQLTGETFDSIDDIKVAAIPQDLRHSRFTSEGALTITDEMKQVMLSAINYALDHPFEDVAQPAAKEDPSEDTTLDVLMIGNSFCYYYPDELKAMADAAGKDLRVCNVYYSGCSLAQHYQFTKNGAQVYAFHENGVRVAENVSMQYCLAQGNWDVISFQEGSGTVRSATADVDALYATNVKYFAYLYENVRERFPMAQFVFHQTWAYQVGTTTAGFTTADAAAQAGHHERIQAYTQKFLDRYPTLDLVNSGDAWAIVREGSYDNLCARLGKGDPLHSGDNYHDGDIGGGQYLNACMWYEYLFGETCVGNTFVPSYTYGGQSFDMLIDLTTLQEAAHQATLDRTAAE